MVVAADDADEQTDAAGVGVTHGPEDLVHRQRLVAHLRQTHPRVHRFLLGHALPSRSSRHPSHPSFALTRPARHARGDGARTSSPINLHVARGRPGILPDRTVLGQPAPGVRTFPVTPTANLPGLRNSVPG
ncbi:hypothetical protein GCM10027070_10080 [Barrientosiimonas humi]